MGMVDDVETALEGYSGADNVPPLAVYPDGEDAAIVGVDPPGHHFGKTILGQQVKPYLEAAGFDVQLDGGLRQIPGLPRGITGGQRISNERAYRQRDLEPPYLRVRRKG